MPRAQYKLSYRNYDDPPRWYKKYHGKTYYFASVRGEGKESSYRRCYSLWLAKKEEIDAAILVATESPAQKAWKAIMDFDEMWMGKCLNENKQAGFVMAQEHYFRAREMYLGNYAHQGVESPGSLPLPQEPETEKPWEQTAPQEQPNSIRSAVAKFMAFKTSQVTFDKCAAGTLANLKLELPKFAAFVGEQKNVNQISAKVVAAYHAHLESSRSGSNYLSNRFTIAKQFIRWCHRNELLDKLPNNLAKNRDLSFSRSIGNPKVISLPNIGKLLNSADDRMLLWLLLSLNCGLNSIDLGTLTQDNVDFVNGTLTRVRTKTKRHKSAPTVQYKLWPRVLELLNKYRPKGSNLLETKHGNLLRESKLVNGKVVEVDNFRYYFTSLQKLTGVKNTARELRATGASIVGNEFGMEMAYRYLADVPSGIASRHYILPDQSKFDEAIAFLGEKLGIEKLRNVVEKIV